MTNYAIHWLVDRYHVGAPPADIAADIERRCTAAGWTRSATRAAVRAALARHEANRKLYAMVTGAL